LNNYLDNANILAEVDNLIVNYIKIKKERGGKMGESSFQSRELQLVIFKISQQEFGVEINQVREIVRLVPITPVPRAPSFIEGVVSLRGQVLAVIDLAKRLNMKASPRSEKTRIIVIETEENTIGMIVDEVTEVLRLPQENIDQAPELIASEIQQKYLKGVGKLGDRLLILIDLVKILSPEEIEDVKKTKVVEEKKEEKKTEKEKKEEKG
jgi:purine-binding chemotaxis protein CheW